jgi:hypothetical protein
MTARRSDDSLLDSPSPDAATETSGDDAAEAACSSAECRRHWQMLAVALAVIVLAFACEVRSDQRVEFRLLPGVPLPEACFSKRLFRVDCPGCGLTRSIVHLAHGRYAASFARHHVGWIFAFLIVAQIPYRLLAIRRGRAPMGPGATRAFAITLIALLVGDWLFRMVGAM